MVTVSRQPTKLDYLSPTQFKFTITQLPKVEFFTTAANIPDISLSDAVIPTPFKSIPVMGQNLTYSNLSITFIVDEFLENYKELHNWMVGIAFPKSRKQFADFRSTVSKTPSATQGTSQDIGDTQPATPVRPMFGDATLTILTNKNNPIVEVRFQDVYPSSLSSLTYDQNATDVTYLTATVTFDYKIYEIVTL